MPTVHRTSSSCSAGGGGLREARRRQAHVPRRGPTGYLVSSTILKRETPSRPQPRRDPTGLDRQVKDEPSTPSATPTQNERSRPERRSHDTSATARSRSQQTSTDAGSEPNARNKPTCSPVPSASSRESVEHSTASEHSLFGDRPTPPDSRTRRQLNRYKQSRRRPSAAGLRRGRERWPLRPLENRDAVSCADQSLAARPEEEDLSCRPW